MLKNFIQKTNDRGKKIIIVLFSIIALTNNTFLCMDDNKEAQKGHLEKINRCPSCTLQSCSLMIEMPCNHKVCAEYLRNVILKQRGTQSCPDCQKPFDRKSVEFLIEQAILDDELNKKLNNEKEKIESKYQKEFQEMKEKFDREIQDLENTKNERERNAHNQEFFNQSKNDKKEKALKRKFNKKKK